MSAGVSVNGLCGQHMDEICVKLQRDAGRGESNRRREMSTRQKGIDITVVSVGNVTA